MILTFQSVQIYVIDAFTLNAASGLSSLVLFISSPRADEPSSIDSISSGLFSPFHRRLRIPTLRALHVQCPGVW